MKHFLKLLLFIQILSTQVEAQSLSFGAVYDLSKGDELVYEVKDPQNLWKGFSNYHLYNKIIDKHWSVNQDTVFYTIRSQRRAHLYNGNFIKNLYSRIDTLELFYTHLKKEVNSIKPDSADFPQYGPYQDIKDTIIDENVSSLCNKHSVGFSRHFLSNRPFSITKRWAKGLGLIMEAYYHKTDTTKNFIKTLIYFKASQEECGNISDHQLSDLSIREVYDFKIGDRFMFRNNKYASNSEYAYMKEVLAVKVDEKKEQLIYTMINTSYELKWTLEPSRHPIYHFTEKDTTEEYYFRINNPVWDLWPAVSSTQNPADLDTIITTENNECQGLSHAFEYRNFFGSGQRMTIAGKFARMRGQVQSYIYLDDENETVENWIQTYSNTHGIECGEVDPALLAGIGDRSLKKDPISLYPNPAVDQLHLYMHNESLLVQRIDFINALGNLVKSIKNTSSNIYDITDLKEGFYVIAILLDGYTIFKKLQIQ